ncbi:MAG TPA: hypothetical protein DEF85_02380 [Clostridiaceae bacterium]|jgi:hypothetical protein|nr:hypothetical protein [Clostridiaceae bacterium]
MKKKEIKTYICTPYTLSLLISYNYYFSILKGSATPKNGAVGPFNMEKVQFSSPKGSEKMSQLQK